MNTKFFASLLSASAIALSSIAMFSSPSHGQRSTYSFFCGRSTDGVPTTFAATATGKKIAVIRWVRQWSPKYPPKARCRAVSSRFQNAYASGVLNYLTNTRVNRQDVICAARRYGGSCNQMLLTLRPGENVSQVIENLRQMGHTASGPLVQAPDGSPRTFVDMNRLLRQASAVK
ncbi:hypothetical protein Riv7116_6080 [Rivularia sp. PCC 7116]|uniref:COP23 domain-containing protein n=1 Tax=Rivularia sp. PCC 7116 TaxID=373994 RepID=UPI00029ECD85|nr:COP23 domain-containing protein [Rivularia sp. PCC 7116]AFY58436.1 hypothetical protein Riv7116_6080 [Rivularia sp. PCC 7116]